MGYGEQSAGSPLCVRRGSLGYALVIALFVTVCLAGCAANGHAINTLQGSDQSIQTAAALPAALQWPGRPRHTRSFMLHLNPPTPFAYVSDSASGFVDVFVKTTGVLVGTIAGLTSPQGLYVDSARNLWVVDAGTSQVFVYPPGSTTPSAILQDPNAIPIDVTVCPGGTAYVSNVDDFSTGLGSVSVYPPGNTIPTSMIRRPGELHGSFLSCDAAGHLFVAYTTNTPTVHGRVFEYISPPAPAGLSVALLANPGAPGGVKPITSGSNAGDVMICDQTAHTVTEYHKSAGVWNPTSNVLLTGNQSSPGSGADDWIDIAVGSPAASFASTRLLAADATAVNGSSWQLNGTHAFVQNYSDPAITAPFGVAYSPPQSGLGP